MKILFLTISNIKTLKERGIYADLLTEFQSKGHEIYIASPREKRLNQPTELIKQNGVNYLRIKIGNVTKTNFVEKGISTITLERKYLRAVKKYYSNIKFDLIIYTTPPITLNKVIKYVKSRDSAKTYLLLKDIFPQNAVDLSLFSKYTPIYWYFRKKEKQLYRLSDHIGCMSKANCEYIIKHNQKISKDIVEVNPNTINPRKIEISLAEKKRIKEYYQIPQNKTIFIYGGNLGKPQGIEFLMEVMAENEKSMNNYMLIVGFGTEYYKLKQYMDNSSIINSKLIKQLPKKEYDKLVAISDVGMIFLDKRFSIPNFPSRILSYMEVAIPILAATDINTDVGKIIEKNNFGHWCESGDIDTFIQYMRGMNSIEYRQELGQNGYDYLKKNYTVKNSYEIIMKHFN